MLVGLKDHILAQKEMEYIRSHCAIRIETLLIETLTRVNGTTTLTHTTKHPLNTSVLNAYSMALHSNAAMLSTEQINVPPN